MEVPRVDPERIEYLIENGYEPLLFDALMKGFRLTMKHKWAFLGFFMIYLLISLALAGIPLLGQLIATFVVQPFFMAGLIWAYYLIWAGKWREFGNFFDLLRFDVWQRFVGVYVLSTLIFLLVYSPSLFALQKAGIIDWYFSYLEDPFGTEPLDLSVLASGSFVVVWLNLIPIIYLAVGYSFAYYHALFVPEYGIWQCLEKSRQLVTRRWFDFFGYYLAYLVIALVAGLLLTLLAVATSEIMLVSTLVLIVMLVVLFWIGMSVYAGLLVAFAELTGLGREPEQGTADEEVSSEDLV